MIVNLFVVWLALQQAVKIHATVLPGPPRSPQLHKRNPDITRGLKAGAQIVFKVHNDNHPESKVSTRLPLELKLPHYLGYSTEIAVGSPPQRFQVQIDISAPDSYVRSSSCSYCTGKPAYNNSLSTTYNADGRFVYLDFFDIETLGYLAQDTLHIGDLRLDNQIFQEANETRSGPSWDQHVVIDGLLGFAPSVMGSVTGTPTPFAYAATSGLLKENIFGLRLREPAELNLGAVNPALFKGDIAYVPLTNASGPLFMTGRWQTAATSVAMGPSSELKWSLDGYTAVFTTVTPFIYLPYTPAVDITRFLDFEDIMFMPPSVDCGRLDTLPDITITLAGTDFVMTPWDYTYEWEGKPGRFRCVSAFQYIGPDEGLEDGTKEIILGTTFVRAFYSVFDLEQRRIGFAKLS